MIKKNKMKKLSVFVIAACILCFCLSACGGGINGTWYKVCADPAAARDNVTFQSDGTFISDVAGEYVIEGDTIRMNFLGLTTEAFKRTEVNGKETLVSKRYGDARWCRTEKDAQELYYELTGE